MKKIIILLFTFWSLIACSTIKNAKEDNSVDNNSVGNNSIDNNADSLILQPSTGQPIIHSGHAAHGSHVSHYSSR